MIAVDFVLQAEISSTLTWLLRKPETQTFPQAAVRPQLIPPPAHFPLLGLPTPGSIIPRDLEGSGGRGFGERTGSIEKGLCPRGAPSAVPHFLLGGLIFAFWGSVVIQEALSRPDSQQNPSLQALPEL